MQAYISSINFSIFSPPILHLLTSLLFSFFHLHCSLRTRLIAAGPVKMRHSPLRVLLAAVLVSTNFVFCAPTPMDDHIPRQGWFDSSNNDSGLNYSWKAIDGQTGAYFPDDRPSSSFNGLPYQPKNQYIQYTQPYHQNAPGPDMYGASSMGGIGYHNSQPGPASYMQRPSYGPPSHGQPHGQHPGMMQQPPQRSVPSHPSMRTMGGNSGAPLGMAAPQQQRQGAPQGMTARPGSSLANSEVSVNMTSRERLIFLLIPPPFSIPSSK
jgi:hypothetical protein